MLKSQAEELEEKAAKRMARRGKRGRPKMKVDGAGVKELYRIISGRSN